MTAATSAAPVAAADTVPTTRPAFEAWYLRHGAGRRWQLQTTAGGQCYLSDVPSSDDAALLAAGRDLAILSRADLL